MRKTIAALVEQQRDLSRREFQSPVFGCRNHLELKDCVVAVHQQNIKSNVEGTFRMHSSVLPASFDFLFASLNSGVECRDSLSFRSQRASSIAGHKIPDKQPRKPTPL